MRSICGETYLLNQDEELWKKELPEEVEELLMVDPLTDRSRKRKQSDGHFHFIYI